MLFFPESLLVYVGMEIADPLTKTKNGHQLVAVMESSYTKLTKVRLTTKTNTTTVPQIILDH